MSIFTRLGVAYRRKASNSSIHAVRRHDAARQARGTMPLEQSVELIAARVTVLEEQIATDKI